VASLEAVANPLVASTSTVSEEAVEARNPLVRLLANLLARGLILTPRGLSRLARHPLERLQPKARLLEAVKPNPPPLAKARPTTR